MKKNTTKDNSGQAEINWPGKRSELQGQHAEIAEELAGLRAQRAVLTVPAFVYDDEAAKGQLTELSEKEGQVISSLDAIGDAIAHCDREIAAGTRRELDAEAKARADEGKRLIANLLRKSGQLDMAIAEMAGERGLIGYRVSRPAAVSLCGRRATTLG